jgi:hypothetical protein
MNIIQTPLFNFLFSFSLAYIAYILMVYWHELGHLGRINPIQIFPIPTGAAIDSDYQYGGILFNIIGSLIPIIFNTLKSTNIFLIFLNLFGLFNFLNVSIYMILGPFIKSKGYILSDINYKDYPAFVLGIIFLLGIGFFYLPFIINLFTFGVLR